MLVWYSARFCNNLTNNLHLAWFTPKSDTTFIFAQTQFIVADRREHLDVLQYFTLYISQHPIKQYFKDDRTLHAYRRALRMTQFRARSLIVNGLLVRRRTHRLNSLSRRADPCPSAYSCPGYVTAYECYR